MPRDVCIDQQGTDQYTSTLSAGNKVQHNAWKTEPS